VRGRVTWLELLARKEGDGFESIFLIFFIFLDTEEYNRNIFLGTKTEEGTGHR
jgi:hypothetical protein